MKRSVIIKTTIVVWILSIIGMLEAVNEYVKAKDKRLSREIDENVRDVFEDRKYVDVLDFYDFYDFGDYEPIAIPIKPDIRVLEYEKEIAQGSGLYAPACRKTANGTIVDDSIPVENVIEQIIDYRIDRWYKKYGCLSNMYKLDNLWWTLVEIKHIPGEFGYRISKGCMETLYFPYAVGFKKPGNYNEAAIKNAVLESFDFLTTNPKSLFIRNGTYERHSYRRIKLKLEDCENEYYSLFMDSVQRYHIDGNPLFEKYPDGYKEGDKPTYPIQFTEIDTEDYRVFIAKTQPRTWSIVKHIYWNPAKDKKELWINWSIGLTVIMLLILIPLWIIGRKERNVN